MSHAATTWAFAQKIESSTKFVLVALADYATTKTNRVYPSIRVLQAKTCLDRKTILAALKRLLDLGFIEDTGNRIGKTRRIPVYQLHLETVPKTESFRKRNCSENGTINRPENGTITPPHVIYSEPEKEPEVRKTPFKPENVTLPFASENFQTAWHDWCKLRVEIHKPLTETAVKQQLLNCEQWGEDRSLAALENSIANSYQGLFEPKPGNSSRVSPVTLSHNPTFTTNNNPYKGAGMK